MNKTAGILIIGDEILKGQVIDENSHFLLTRAYKLGIKVCKLSFISDDINVIAHEVSEFSKKYDFVITTGGTGATHDDVTYAGVAKAFNEELIIKKELKEWVFSFTCERCTDIIKNPAMKMAQVPRSASLLYVNKGSGKSFLDSMPVVCVANVYIFPGIPSYLHYLFDKLEYVFKSNNKNIWFFQCLYLSIPELDFVELLNTTVEKFRDWVTFGSYPILDNELYCSKITIESHNKDKVWEAEKFLTSQLPEESVVKKASLHPDDIISTVYFKEKLLMKSNLLEKVKTSVKVIEECLKKYNFSDICISFNGGKDCTVLLHLTCAVIWHNNVELLKEKARAFYVGYDDPFPEVEDFVNEAVKSYNLDLKTIPGPIKQALSSLLDERSTKAILMGTRRTDPYSASLSSFQMTDSDWPQVMRVHPILNWSYEDIWTFLRCFEIPYCGLYDMGYTSIGSRKNTLPNPKLSYSNDKGEVKYHPAYLLADESSERSGRN